MGIKRVLLVCTGNTCRSPMAEAVLKEKHKGVSVKSAGMQALAGTPAAPHARIVVREHGANLDEHRAEPLTQSLLAWADRVWTMTEGQALQIAQHYPDFRQKIETLANASGFQDDITDPVGGDLDEYRRTVQQIERMLENIEWGHF